MAQPSIPGNGIGIPRMPYGFDGSDWIALLVNALGRLQIDSKAEATPDDTFTHDNVTMGLAAAVIKAANAGRLGIAIYNLGDETIYLGNDNTVTTGNGFPLLSNTGIYFDGYTGAVWGISGTAGQDVRYLEV